MLQLADAPGLLGRVAEQRRTPEQDRQQFLLAVRIGAHSGDVIPGPTQSASNSGARASVAVKMMSAAAQATSASATPAFRPC